MVPCMYELAVGDIFLFLKKRTKHPSALRKTWKMGKLKTKVKSHCKSTLASIFF